MRKYRGQRVSDKKWVEGWYACDEEWAKHYIYFQQKPDGLNKQVYWKMIRTEVIPSTVGQQVGLKDKNGVEIYADHILSLIILEGVEPSLVKVINKYGCCGYEPLFPEKEHEDDREWKPFYCQNDKELIDMNYFEVIGNI